MDDHSALHPTEPNMAVFMKYKQCLIIMGRIKEEELQVEKYIKDKLHVERRDSWRVECFLW